MGCAAGIDEWIADVSPGTWSHPANERPRLHDSESAFSPFAPALRALCLKALAKSGKLSNRLLRLLVWRVQDKAERYNRGIRLSTMKQDKKLQEALGFAGTRR